MDRITILMQTSEASIAFGLVNTYELVTGNNLSTPSISFGSSYTGRYLVGVELSGYASNELEAPLNRSLIITDFVGQSVSGAPFDAVPAPQPQAVALAPPGTGQINAYAAEVFRCSSYRNISTPVKLYTGLAIERIGVYLPFTPVEPISGEPFYTVDIYATFVID